jgi:hypothetical protein
LVGAGIPEKQLHADIIVGQCIVKIDIKADVRSAGLEFDRLRPVKLAAGLRCAEVTANVGVFGLAEDK